MKIALAQMEVVQGDIQANIAKMEKFILYAKRKKADVIVFPEDSLTGVAKGRPELVDSEGRFRKLFSALARQNSIDIVAGSFIESYNGKWYNTACYFDYNGRLLAAYRKITLWHSEREYLERGSEVSVFDTKFGRAGLAICWDLSNPGIFRKMAKRGASVIFVPSFWSDAGISNRETESRNIDALCHVRAFENECAIAYANAAGKLAPNDTLVGHSQLVVPIKGAIKRLTHNREALAVADVPMGVLERAAGVYRIKRDIQEGLF